MMWLMWFAGITIWGVSAFGFGVFNGGSLLGAILFVVATVVLIRKADVDV